MSRFGIVYKITNTINNKVYIGQTIDTMDNRIQRHIKGNSRVKSYIHNALNKEGIHNFKFEELYTSFDAEDLNMKEQLFIEQYKSLSSQHGYNLKSSGGQPRVSKAITDKMAIAKIGKKHTNNKPVRFTNKITGESFIIRALEDIKDSREFRIKGIRKLLAKGKNNYKQYNIEYVNRIYVNQSGSTETKDSGHAQRIGDEPTSVDYNSPTSYRSPNFKIKPYVHEIIKMYEVDKMSTRRIATFFNVNKDTVTRLLKSMNVDVYKNSKMNPKRRIRYAELLGNLKK